MHNSLEQAFTPKSNVEKFSVEKFIVFPIADYHFALPIEDVLQVVKRPETPPELSNAGFVQIGRHVIRLLDLQQPLESSLYLVITQSLPGELWAIPVNEPPDLIEFPVDLWRVLPESPQSSLLRLASHTAIVTQDGITTTVFLLDLKRRLDAIAIQSSNVV